MAVPKLKSCGILCFRQTPEPSFLLMKHPDRWDLPKGHIKKGESELECALREFNEETGLDVEQLTLVPDFRFEIKRYIQAERFNGRRTLKTYVIFVGLVHGRLDITPTEHQDFQWIAWQPPHHISEWLIDPLLSEVEKLFTDHPVFTSTQE
jgi:bis(5'-nucleosidyl)-tetraphosphatase